MVFLVRNINIYRYIYSTTYFFGFQQDEDLKEVILFIKKILKFINHQIVKGDALFSIGLKTEKHKRLIVCADDLQRDKLMNTILRTSLVCQTKYFKTINGTNRDAIKRIKTQGFRDTLVKNDNELSSSSLDTRTYNNEYSRSETDRTDITDSIHATPNGHIHHNHAYSHKQSHSNNNNNNNGNLNDDHRSVPSGPGASTHTQGGHHHQNKTSSGGAHAGHGYTNPLSTVKENSGIIC